MGKTLSSSLFPLPSSPFPSLKNAQKVSKQIIRRLDKAWTSYFAAFKEWKKEPDKFLGVPKIPKYKHKTKGRNILPYPDESIYKKP